MDCAGGKMAVEIFLMSRNRLRVDLRAGAVFLRTRNSRSGSRKDVQTLVSR